MFKGSRSDDQCTHRGYRQVLSAQLNAVMHSPEFQKLEGAWRGLHYLVMQCETCTMLKIRVLEHQQEMI